MESFMNTDSFAYFGRGCIICLYSSAHLGSLDLLGSLGDSCQSHLPDPKVIMVMWLFHLNYFWVTQNCCTLLWGVPIFSPKWKMPVATQNAAQSKVAAQSCPPCRHSEDIHSKQPPFLLSFKALTQRAHNRAALSQVTLSHSHALVTLTGA